MKKRVVKFVVILMCMTMAVYHSYAQGIYKGVTSVKLSSSQITQLEDQLKQNAANDTIYNITVSKCLLDSFHEFGDYGPYIDGKTTSISLSGYRIEYHCDNIRKMFCSFHKTEDSCRGFKNSITIFIPDDLSRCYRSYICKWGFPPSFGGAAKIKDMDARYRKIVKIITDGK